MLSAEKTQNDKCKIDDREITIYNYTNRSQIVDHNV